jgi:hypothetical protein
MRYAACTCAYVIPLPTWWMTRARAPQNHGFCRLGRLCSKSHDLDIILDDEQPRSHRKRPRPKLDAPLVVPPAATAPDRGQPDQARAVRARWSRRVYAR